MAVSAFTDDDLKREYFSDEEIAEAKEKFPKKDRIHALLARLEASEQARTRHADTYCECSKCTAWRKAAGK